MGVTRNGAQAQAQGRAGHCSLGMVAKSSANPSGRRSSFDHARGEGRGGEGGEEPCPPFPVLRERYCTRMGLSRCWRAVSPSRGVSIPSQCTPDARQQTAEPTNVNNA